MNFIALLKKEYNFDFECNQMWLQQIFGWSVFRYLIQKSYKFHLKWTEKFK